MDIWVPVGILMFLAGVVIYNFKLENGKNKNKKNKNRERNSFVS